MSKNTLVLRVEAFRKISWVNGEPCNTSISIDQEVTNIKSCIYRSFTPHPDTHWNATPINERFSVNTPNYRRITRHLSNFRGNQVKALLTSEILLNSSLSRLSSLIRLATLTYLTQVQYLIPWAIDAPRSTNAFSLKAGQSPADLRRIRDCAKLFTNSPSYPQSTHLYAVILLEKVFWRLWWMTDDSRDA